MGLLDALFSGGNSGGGLLDFLKNNALNQQFPGMPQGDQAQYGQPMGAMAQAPIMAQRNPQPSPLDTAQWPAGPVGAPSQASAQMPPQQPPPVIQAQPVQQSLQQPPSPGGLGAGVSGFMNNLQTGPVGALIGGIGSAMGMQNPQTVAAAQHANITAQALLAKGVDPAVVAAAVGNGRVPGEPELLKTLITQNFGPGKFQHVTLKNLDGSESPRSFNPDTGEYSGAPASSQGASSVDPALTGQERMDALKAADPNYARKIQSMVSGDIPLPTSGQAARSPQAQRMVEDVLAVDGATSASDFATRAATRRDYASGMASRVTKSLNTTIEHAARLDESIDKLGNHTYFPGITNFVHDKVAGSTDPEYQKAKSEFESNKEAFIKELDFTLSGGHSSVSGSAQLRDNINRADSPEALHAAVQADLHLLSARLDSHTKGFAEGTKSQRDPQDFLYPKNRSTFNKLMGSADTSTGQPVPGVDASPATQTAPQAAQAPDRSAIEAEMRRRGLMK